MLAITALTVLIGAGVGFYSRFLVALCREAVFFESWKNPLEPESGRSGPMMRLEIRPDELPTIEEPGMDESAPITV
jgi:hypothetical protein